MRLLHNNSLLRKHYDIIGRCSNPNNKGSEVWKISLNDFTFNIESLWFCDNLQFFGHTLRILQAIRKIINVWAWTANDLTMSVITGMVSKQNWEKLSRIFNSLCSKNWNKKQHNNHNLSQEAFKKSFVRFKDMLEII